MWALRKALPIVALSALLAGCGGYSGFNNANWGQQRSYSNGPAYGYTNSRPINNNTTGSRYYPNANCWDCGRS
jgi:hypothetical protein